MDKKQKQAFEDHIRTQITKLKEDIRSFKDLVKPVSPDNAIGRITRMEAINSKSINEAALRKAENNLERLEHLLPMLSDPDFGLCAECEEPIPFARLMIVPETLYCVTCAEKLNH